jgi:NAD(P)-dependent dehydrogenase (short-subunit alcohol dehydrogenase family)
MISEGYVKNGAKVYISSRDAKSCQEVAAELTKMGPGTAHSIPADFYKLEDCKKLADELAKRETHLDVLVNNSGSNWGAPYDEYPDNAWIRVLTLNLQRVFTITQLLTPLLEKAQKKGDPARIINIGSVDGLKVPALETFAYSSSKAGLHHLSRVLANHLGKRNITYCAYGSTVMRLANITYQVKHNRMWSIPIQDDESHPRTISGSH